MIVFKAIKPGVQFKSSIFRDEVRKSAQALAPRIQKDFEATTRTWKEKPAWKVEVNSGVAAGGALAKAATGSATGASIYVATDDPVYRYVDEGTRVRYALMSRDFKAKTTPRIIGSRTGRGHLVVVDKKHPRPGIKARQFSKVIQQKWQPVFRAEMAAAIQRAAQRSGHGAR